MGEMTQAKSESLGKGLMYRVHIDSEHPLEKYGFLPGTNFTVNWNDENDFTVSSTTEPTLEVVWETVALNVNLPPRLQDEGEIQYQLKWSQGLIIGSPVPNELPFHLSGSENNEIDNVEEAEEEEFDEEEFEEEEFEEEEFDEEEFEEEEFEQVFQEINMKTWIEHSSNPDRPDRAEGEWRLGKRLWCPTKSKSGGDIYKHMRKVSKGDRIIHIAGSSKKLHLRGVSKVKSDGYKELEEGLKGTEWEGRPAYILELEGYEQLDPFLPRGSLLNKDNAEEMHEIRRRGMVFYDKNLDLNQGAYITPCSEELAMLLNTAYVNYAQSSLPYFENRSKSPSTNLEAPSDNGSPTKEYENREFMVQLRDVIEKTDNSRSSNSKYKIPPPGSDYSVRQLIAEFLEIDEGGVYIVGVTTRFHNLRKNLLQSTQNDHRVGVGIYLGEDWKGQTLRRYINDEKITHNFKDGVLFFCLFNGVLVFVGASLTSDIHEFKLRRLREEAVVQVHKSSNAPAGKLGELIKIMQGQTISSAKTEYHCSLVNEFVVIFDESEKTGRVMLPTDLVMEWIEAMENGAINTSMSPRKCRKIVSKNSKWAAHLHSLETHLKATVTHWHNSSHSSQLE
jgi:hypothetical protein